MRHLEADKTIEDYVSYDWERLKAYDGDMRVSLSEDTSPDPFSSSDERTFHLARLALSARVSGDRRFVDLLLDWFADDRFAEWPRLQMTILVSLVYATFYRTAIGLFETILSGSTREWVVRGMCDDQVMFLSWGMMAPFFPEPVASRYRELFNRRKPWVPEDQLYQEVREGFLSQVKVFREKNDGGWEEIGSGAPTVPKQAVFIAGQFFDALRPIEALISAASQQIVLIDGYATSDTLALLCQKRSGVAVAVLTKTVAPQLRTAALAFNRQYGGLSLRTSQQFHDRFLVIDGTDFYHIGASIKDLGKRTFMYSRVDDVVDRTRLWQDFQAAWSSEGDAM